MPQKITYFAVFCGSVYSKGKKIWFESEYIKCLGEKHEESNINYSVL